MKKMFIWIVICILTLLCGCDPASYYFKSTEYKDKIQKIELVLYTNESYKMVNPSKESLKFDWRKTQTLEILDESKNADFLLDFQKIVFHISKQSVNEPTGYCLIWHLRNGNFIVFSCTMIAGDRAYDMAAEFDSNNIFIKHYAHFASRPHYENILEKYFEEY